MKGSTVVFAITAAQLAAMRDPKNGGPGKRDPRESLTAKGILEYDHAREWGDRYTLTKFGKVLAAHLAAVTF